jgi:TrmH family RNA methyltransferase
MLQISSRTNAVYRKYMSLLESKGLKKEGLFLLSGKSLVAEFLRNPTLTIEAEIVTEELKPLCKTCAHVQMAPSLFDELDILGTHSNLLVLKQPEMPAWDFSKTPPGLHLLLPLGDPSNLGAVARSAEAFGVQNLIFLKEAAHPFLPKSMKASAGSLTRMKIWKGPGIKELSANPIYALDLSGEELSQVKWPATGYLLVGEEGAGVPNLKGLKKISIPMKSSVESLNATVATSIALYDYNQKLKS